MCVSRPCNYVVWTERSTRQQLYIHSSAVDGSCGPTVCLFCRLFAGLLHVSFVLAETRLLFGLKPPPLLLALITGVPLQCTGQQFADLVPVFSGVHQLRTPVLTVAECFFVLARLPARSDLLGHLFSCLFFLFSFAHRWTLSVCCIDLPVTRSIAGSAFSLSLSFLLSSRPLFQQCESAAALSYLPRSVLANRPQSASASRRNSSHSSSSGSSLLANKYCKDDTLPLRFDYLLGSCLVALC